MPVRWNFTLVRRWCQRTITWSHSRGGCRFEPGHAGACKPGRTY
jgi:hypothetical protein